MRASWSPPSMTWQRDLTTNNRSTQSPLISVKPLTRSLITDSPWSSIIMVWKENTLKWIESFLANHSQQVVVDGESSRPAPVISGVPQGTVLWPLLFLIYINDLPKEVNSTSRLFADECLLYRTIRSEADTIQMQEDLDRLQMLGKELVDELQSR